MSSFGIPFQPFDRDLAVFVYQNNLPHWRQPGATYFVTFRLADSIPRAVLEGWEAEKREWLRTRHGIELDRENRWKNEFELLPFRDREDYRREFHRRLNDYLDGGRGECVLRDPACARLVEEKALSFDGERYDLGDLIVMPNHVHLLIKPNRGQRLERILQGIKGVSAREINRRLERTGTTLWQKDSFDHIVRNADHLRKFQRYIAENPMKAGLRPDRDREGLIHRTAEFVFE